MNSINSEKMHDKKITYRVEVGQTYKISYNKNGDEEKTPICNFYASIVAEEIQDNGIERERILKIRGWLASGEELKETSVLAKDFGSMNWVFEHWGFRLIIYAGFSNRDHLRVAIQELSEKYTLTTVHTHTGWKKIEGEWVFLHAGGAIGPNGNSSAIQFNAERGNLGKYDLTSDSKIDLITCIKSSLEFLALAPKRITYPLFASIFRSILCEIVGVDFAIFVEGPSGVFKSEVTALVQAFFGKTFSSRNFPGSWTSTANYIGSQLFLAKDVIMVVDDFAPQASYNARQSLNQKAEDVFRAQGNHTGKGRMRADSTLRPSFPPRGFVIASGEDVPSGQSLKARLIVLELKKGDVDILILSKLQGYARDGVFVKLLSSFIQYVAMNFFEFQKILLHEQQGIRNILLEHELPHKRTADSSASLILGLDLAFRFFKECGALSEQEAKDLKDEGIREIFATAQNQESYQSVENPAQQFIDSIKADLSSGNSYLADSKTENAPKKYAEAVGWRNPSQFLDSSNTPCNNYDRPRGDKIGWIDIDSDEVLLSPEMSYSCAIRRNKESGGTGLFSKQGVSKRLVESGIVIPCSSEKKNVTKRQIHGRRESVWVIPRHHIVDAVESTPFSKMGDSGDTRDKREDFDPNGPTSINSLRFSVPPVSSVYQN